MESNSAIPSHKRTVSSTTLDGEPPKSKQRTDNTSTLPQSLPEYVYVVLLESYPAYGDPGSEVRGVFCSIEDANNAVKGIVADEFTSAEQCSKGTRADGRLYWKSHDVGEGDSADISIEKHQVHTAGTYPAREWPSEMGWDDHEELGKEGHTGEEDEEEDGEEDRDGEEDGDEEEGEEGGEEEGEGEDGEENEGGHDEDDEDEDDDEDDE
jgi:hypothetical protein